MNIPYTYGKAKRTINAAHLLLPPAPARARNIPLISPTVCARFWCQNSQGHMSGFLSPVSILQICGLCGSRNAYSRVGDSHGSSTGAAAAGGVIRSSSVETGAAGASSGKTGVVAGEFGTAASAKRKTWTYSANHETWNYFDIHHLPHSLRDNS